jgi:2'-5' RNA ligase
MRSAIASKIEKIVLDAKRSDKTTVFLGGSCMDNAWREDLKKEFGDTLFLIDPYDEDWDASDNTYDEIAGMLGSDWVIFYDGGKQTEHEKNFLKNVDQDKHVKEFKDLDKVKEFLKSLKKPSTKLACISDRLYRSAMSIMKLSMPWVHARNEDIDLFFEYLDTDSIKHLIADFEAGKTIRIPAMKDPVTGAPVPEESFSRKDFPAEYYTKILEYLHFYMRKGKGPHELLVYDPTVQVYRKKEAKVGATYSFSSTQVDLPKQLAQEIISWGKAHVPDKDLHSDGKDTKGREDEIHVTLFYGIKDDSPEKVAELLKSIDPFECRLGLVTAFKDDNDYDVLKIDVESPELIKMHYLLEGKVDNKNTHPTYQAHITVAYVKKGKADRHIGDTQFRGRTFRVDQITFSSKDHIRYEIPLGR